MAKEESIKVSGKVVDALPGTLFKVLIDEQDHIILCTLSGKMRQNRIRVLINDDVDVEFSPYNFSRGRITRRQK